MTAGSKIAAPAGTWPSPVTSELIVADSIRLAEPTVVDGALFWLEGRPSEKGRVVLVRKRKDGRIADLVPRPFSVRSKVHEYGGRAWTVHGARAWFVNAADQRVYVVAADGKAPDADCQPLTAAGSLQRYTDLLVDAPRDRLIAVCEDHSGDGEARTTLVAIALGDGAVTTLAAGADFYSSPALDAAGERLAYLRWSHPNMPWDETELMLAGIDATGALHDAQRIGIAGASIFQPSFGCDDALYYVADYSDWWNIYRYADGAEQPLTCDVGEYALPQWVFGMSTYAHLDANTLLAMLNRRGVWSLVQVDIARRRTSPVTHFDYDSCDHLHAADGRAVVLAGNAATPLSVVEVTLNDSRAITATLRVSSAIQIEPDSLSKPQAIAFASGEDAEAYGFYYPPCNADYTLAADERPPLLVKCHGGPTSATTTALDPRIQFWTSRGFAVLDVNYRGSTGYGRLYRHSLHGRWGIADVEDCVNGAQALADRGLADPERCVIAGSSAGGYTVLAALAFSDFFAAGASHYGIGDLTLLASDTHKFEARYLDRLVGPYPAAEEVYRQRSPLLHAQRIACPVIFFQGLDDKVVPPNQAETMVAALRDNGTAVAYVPFEGEGHGFRNADNIRYSLDAQLAFFGRVLGFTPAGDAVDLTIENLD